MTFPYQNHQDAWVQLWNTSVQFLQPLLPQLIHQQSNGAGITDVVYRTAMEVEEDEFKNLLMSFIPTTRKCSGTSLNSLDDRSCANLSRNHSTAGIKQNGCGRVNLCWATAVAPPDTDCVVSSPSPATRVLKMNVADEMDRSRPSKDDKWR